MNSIQELFDSLKAHTGWDEKTLTELNAALNDGGKFAPETAERLKGGLEKLTTQEKLFKDITSGTISDREVLKPIANFFTGKTLSGIESNVGEAFLTHLGDFIDKEKANEILKGEGKTSEKVAKLVEMAKAGANDKLARVSTTTSDEWEGQRTALNEQIKSLEATVKAVHEEKEKEIETLKASYITRYRNKAISEQVAKHTANLITKPEVVGKLVLADLPSNFEVKYNAENEGWDVHDTNGKASTLEAAVSGTLEALGLLKANDKGSNGKPGPQNTQTPERVKAPTTYTDQMRQLAKQKAEETRARFAGE